MSDTKMIEERLRGFLAAPGDVDWQDVLRRAGETSTRTAPRFTRRRMVLVLAASIAVAAPAVVFSGVLSSSHTGAQQNQSPVTSSRPPSRPLGFMPIALHFMRGAQGVTSIDVTVHSSSRDATMQLEVLRGNPYGPDSGRKVVFQRQVPMTNIASPAAGPTGTVARSTWSGTLSPSDWDGGCQNALYAVKAQGQGMITLSQWFSCSSG